MDILTKLNSGSNYSSTSLQFILGAWVMSGLLDRKKTVSLHNGHVSEDDYNKQSIYSLLYSMYRTMGEVRDENGEPYEFTFNTWGYAWPDGWGESPTTATDPQRFGKNAYSELFTFPAVKDHVRAAAGKVHVVEMGCGTGAGAHHVCRNVLPECTYQAVDMQQAAIRTCERKFVPELSGRLVATCADCTTVDLAAGSADIIVVCETHVTEMTGRVTDEDKSFFQAMHRTLKPGGYLVWGNAIPDSTWQPCFDFLESIGMKLAEVRDVTREAVVARDEDAARVDAYVAQCLDRFHAFHIPFLGRKKRRDAELALKNFFRNPGTNLYKNMTDGTDSYKVILLQKIA